MATNHAGESARPCSGLGAVPRAGMGRNSGAAVRTISRRNSDGRAATVFRAAPGILATIDRRAKRGLRAAIDPTAVVGPRGRREAVAAFGRPVVLGLRAAIVQRVSTDVPVNTACSSECRRRGQ